jgi:hypothetical protein
MGTAEGSGVIMKAFWFVTVMLLCVASALIVGKGYFQGLTDISKPESEFGRRYVDPIFGPVAVLPRVRAVAAAAEMRTIQQAIISFNLREDRIPSDLAELVEAGDLKPEALKDADGRKYRVRADEEGRVSIVSPGADGITGTTDDVSFTVEGIQVAKAPAPTPVPTVAWSSLYPTPTPKRLFGAGRNIEK